MKAIFQKIRQSFKNEHADFTSINIRTAVFLLAIPMILELSLESVFAVVDMFFVGKLGAGAIATVGLTESVITIIYSIAIGLSVAATAVVARRIGEKNPDDAAHAGAQALIISLFVTVLLSITGIIFAPQILGLMGATAEVVQNGAIYTRLMLGGSATIMLLFLINGIFRGAGDAAMAMKSLWIASLINIILDPIFIHFWGLKGAAIATLIGRGTGVLYQCYHLYKGAGMIKFRTPHFKWDSKVIKTLLTIGWPATLQFIIASGSWILLARLVAETGGTDATAGYQIAIRCFLFFMLPAWGLSNAAATLVGQNLGAQKPDRAEESVKITAKYNAAFMGIVTILFLLFAPQIVGFFTQEPTVLNYGIQALRIIGSGYIFYAIAMVMTQALNGAGDTKTPTMLNIVCFWILQIPLAYLLAKYFHLGPLGIFIAIPTSESVLALMAWYYFAKGKWKEVRV